VDRDEGRGGGTAIGHRFHDERGFKPAQTDAAALFRHIDGAKAQFGGLADGVAGEMMILVPLGRMGRDRIGGEALRQFLHGALLVGEVELGHGACLILSVRHAGLGPASISATRS